MSTRPPPPPNTRSTKREPRAAAGRRRPTRRWMAEALGVLVIAAVADGSLRAIVAQLDDRVDMRDCPQHRGAGMTGQTHLLSRDVCAWRANARRAVGMVRPSCLGGCSAKFGAA